MSRVVAMVALVLAVTGCATARLEHATGKQASTLSEIDRQQVLDNLALFAYDFEALPFFAYASQGTTAMSDQSGLSFTNLLQWQTQESWQLTPVNDPRKLELMRCLYQRVMAIHRRQAIKGDCPNCTRLFSNFYTGDPDLRLDQRDHGGTVTVECVDAPKWLGIGCAKCLPERSSCRCLVGTYCDVRVWVLPGGSEELSKLTLAVLDYALHDPPAKGNKTVTFHLTEAGALTTADKSFADVSGQVGADATSDSLMTLPYVTALEHICARNQYGLAVEALQALDLAALSDADGFTELRARYHISDDEWSNIRDLLVKLKSHQVDSPLEHIEPASAKDSREPSEETTELPAPEPTVGVGSSE